MKKLNYDFSFEVLEEIKEKYKIDEENIETLCEEITENLDKKLEKIGFKFWEFDFLLKGENKEVKLTLMDNEGFEFISTSVSYRILKEFKNNAIKILCSISDIVANYFSSGTIKSNLALNFDKFRFSCEILKASKRRRILRLGNTGELGTLAKGNNKGDFLFVLSEIYSYMPNIGLLRQLVNDVNFYPEKHSIVMNDDIFGNLFFDVSGDSKNLDVKIIRKEKPKVENDLKKELELVLKFYPTIEEKILNFEYLSENVHIKYNRNKGLSDLKILDGPSRLVISNGEYKDFSGSDEFISKIILFLNEIKTSIIKYFADFLLENDEVEENFGRLLSISENSENFSNILLVSIIIYGLKYKKKLMSFPNMSRIAKILPEDFKYSPDGKYTCIKDYIVIPSEESELEILNMKIQEMILLAEADCGFIALSEERYVVNNALCFTSLKYKDGNYEYESWFDENLKEKLKAIQKISEIQEADVKATIKNKSYFYSKGKLLDYI